MDFQIAAEILGQYGFPIVAASGGGYMIYYIWKWATTDVKPIIDDTNDKLISLIDHIRTLDNDLIRLNQKLNVILQMRNKKCKSFVSIDDEIDNQNK